MRPIDADALSRRVDYCVGKGLGSTIAFTFMHMIEESPTIDAVPVIRCKDCRYDHECKHEMIRKSRGGGVIYCPVEFCSEGKRKEE